MISVLLTMLNSAQARVNEQWAAQSNPLEIQTIHKYCTSLKVHLYGAKAISVTKRTQFQIHLNSALQVATKWFNTDRRNTKQAIVASEPDAYTG